MTTSRLLHEDTEMMMEPKCFTRNCAHFQGVDGEEPDQVVVCAAFPEGIPDAIAYGMNRHTTPFPGDNGIQFERGD